MWPAVVKCSLLDLVLVLVVDLVFVVEVVEVVEVMARLGIGLSCVVMDVVDVVDVVEEVVVDVEVEVAMWDVYEPGIVVIVS